VAEPASTDLLLKVLQFAWLVLLVPYRAMKEQLKDAREETKKAQETADKTRERLNKHELHVANNYHTKEDMRELIESNTRPIKESVERIEGYIKRLLPHKRHSDQDAD